MKRFARAARGRIQLVLWRALDRLAYVWAGGKRRRVTYDIDRTCPGLRAIERNFDMIDEELRAILPRLDQIPRYQDVDPKQYAIAEEGAGSWRTLFLYIRGGEDEFQNRALCPRTFELLRSIPGVGQAFFSILEPGKPIKEHEGPHHYYLRCHTAFRVPKLRPPTLRIADQRITWRERESVLFDDTWNHEVYNESDEPRVVLVTDVVRPALPVRALYRLTHGLACLGVSPERWRKYYAPFDALSAPSRTGELTPVAPGSPRTGAADRGVVPGRNRSTDG